MSWLDHAACRDLVCTSDFYGPAPTADALGACAFCVVKAACLADELDPRPPLEEVQGYRAGLRAEERRELLAQLMAQDGQRLREARVERVRSAVQQGARVDAIAEAEGVHRRTISRWLHTHSEISGRAAS